MEADRTACLNNCSGISVLGLFSGQSNGQTTGLTIQFTIIGDSSSAVVQANVFGQQYADTGTPNWEQTTLDSWQSPNTGGQSRNTFLRLLGLVTEGQEFETFRTRDTSHFRLAPVYHFRGPQPDAIALSTQLWIALSAIPHRTSPSPRPSCNMHLSVLICQRAHSSTVDD